MEIKIIQGNLLEAKVDAIVNPANSQGFMGGGVAAAIQKIGGNEIEQAAIEQAPISVGQAVLTTAGSLPYKGIIHAPTMEHPSEPIPAKQVEMATLAALRLADEKNLTSIAFPGMGTGVGRVDVDEAAKIMIDTIKMYRADNQLKEIHLIAFNQDLFKAFNKYM